MSRALEGGPQCSRGWARWASTPSTSCTLVFGHGMCRLILLLFSSLPAAECQVLAQLKGFSSLLSSVHLHSAVGLSSSLLILSVVGELKLKELKARNSKPLRREGAKKKENGKEGRQGAAKMGLDLETHKMNLHTVGIPTHYDQN